MRVSRLCIWLLMMLALLQLGHFGPQMPERIAMHFDGRGVADGWSSRAEFYWTTIAMTIGMGLLFLGVTWWVGRVPDAAINLPNKAYWLAPERRAATLDYMARQMEWLAAATLLLMLGITQLTVGANLTGGGTLGDAFWWLFGGYMLFVVVWLVSFLRRTYARVPQQHLR